MGKKSRTIKTKEIEELEPGEYSIGMCIAEDCKGFDLEVRSATPMEAQDIVQAIEEWLYSNLLEGYDLKSDSRH